MRTGACGSAAEQIGKAFLVELVAFQQLADVDRKNLERPDLGSRLAVSHPCVPADALGGRHCRPPSTEQSRRTRAQQRDLFPPHDAVGSVTMDTPSAGKTKSTASPWPSR
jgi:hypothetical protein